jgi:hypothetical protein
MAGRILLFDLTGFARQTARCPLSCSTKLICIIIVYILEVTSLIDSFLPFLLEAKRQTYASAGDEASVAPLLPGSRQLEYRDGPFFYRDIYFGVSYFVGQETVYYDEQPVWAMSYAGGVDGSITAPADVKRIYAFLRSALRQACEDYPFRGPKEHCDGTFTYKNVQEGTVDLFRGTETILKNGQQIYRLQYGGGLIR